jgi:hypothetical protein
MKKQWESIFKAFTVIKVFAGILGMFFLVNITDAAGRPFEHYTAKGGMRICLHKLNDSVNGLKACNTNLVQARTDLGTCNTDLDQTRTDLETCNTGLDQVWSYLGICNVDLDQAQVDLGTCNTALSVCESHQVSSSDGASVAKTGQTTSYAAGDDGDLQAGTALTTPRFVDNGDGTVNDNLTGLTWMKDAGSIGASYWGNAVQTCSALASGSYGLSDGSIAGDWRLPNVRELNSLIDYGHYNYALPDGHLFINVMYNYWSSTTYAGNLGYALYLNPINGLMSFANKTGSNVYVLCVRNGL